MKTKIVLITGATDGIGKQTACELLLKDADVIIHGRSETKARNTADELKSLTGRADVKYLFGDLSSLKEVEAIAQQCKDICDKLDVLINNAGVYFHERELSADGFELTFAVNHLAHFYLTNLLLPILKNTSAPRVVTVSSVAHSRAKFDIDDLNAEKFFSGYNAYAVSKLCNVLFAYELAEREKNFGLLSNALHPGVITTKLLQKGFNMSGASLKDGAATSVYLASSIEVEGITGKYFSASKETQSSVLSRDRNLQKQLWEASENMCGMKDV